MNSLKAIICTIGLTYFLNISMTSVYPLMLLAMFLCLFFKIKDKSDNKMMMASLGITVICTILYLVFIGNDFVLSIKYLLIILAIYFIVELLIDYFNTKIGDKNG